MSRPPDREIIEARLDSLKETLDILHGLRDLSPEEYRADRVRRSAVERLLCRLVDVAAEINGHISARVLGQVPQDYHDTFIKAAEAGALDRGFALQIARSTGLRNRIVHQYETVDHELVYRAIPQALDDYRRYLTDIVAYLDRLGSGGRA